jgi:hypothetical protein
MSDPHPRSQDENPLKPGESYVLRLPDGRVLGHVYIRGLEDGWAEGSFRAAAAFDGLRPLFEEEARLRNDQIIPLWEAAADRIAALGIQVVGEGGEEHAGLRIFVEGDEAFLAAGSAELRRSREVHDTR